MTSIATTHATTPSRSPRSKSPVTTRRSSPPASEQAALIAEASNPDTSPERLAALARLSPQVTLAVAANPCTPAATLDRLSRGKSHAWRAVIAGNPNATFETLVRCIPSNPVGFLRNPAVSFLMLEREELLKELPLPAFVAILTHPETPAALLQPCIERSIRERDARCAGLLLSRADLSKEDAGKLAKHHWWAIGTEPLPHVSSRRPCDLDAVALSVDRRRGVDSLGIQGPGRAALARSRPLPTDLLLAMLTAATPDARAAIASNPRTPVQVLERLEADPNPHVTIALHANPSTPEPLRRRITPRALDMHMLFCGKPTPTELANLARHPCFEVKLAVALHPDAPTLACELLARHRSLVLRRLAAAHPNTPEPSLLRLVEEGRWLPIDLESVRTDLLQFRLPAVIRSPQSISLMALHSLISLHERMARDGGRPVADSMGVRPLITHEGVPQSLLERVLHAAPPSALADYARFDQAHPSLLQAIAHRHTDLNLLTAIAESPRTPSSVLEELSRHQSVQVRRGAASNPRLPEPCARALLRDVDCSDRIAWHPCLSHEERRQLMPRGAEFVQAVIEHPEHLALLPLLMHPDFSSIQLLVDRSLSTSAIDLLASQPFPPNRMLADLSRHPNSSPELLRRIAATGRPECLEGVAANPSTPADLILELMRAKRPSRRIARLAAANPSLPASALDEAEPHLLGAWLADYQGCPGWPFMLSHPACPESRLRGHANSHDWRNRLMVAINRSTPLDVLRRLMQDGLLPLRHAAKRTLQSLGHAA